MEQQITQSSGIMRLNSKSSSVLNGKQENRLKLTLCHLSLNNTVSQIAGQLRKRRYNQWNGIVGMARGQPVILEIIVA